jgi:aminoglycoside 3-N-acetyltransferase
MDTEKGEARVIALSEGHALITARSITKDLYKLGVKKGMTLLVHSSLSSIGWVCGSAASVVLALEEAIGPDGTLVMPTHSGDLSDPAEWKHPPIPSEWWEEIRSEMPPYKADLTPTRQMGAIPECFRKQEGVVRSSHPQVSFAARGKKAEFITQSHKLDYSLGESSPLARIYELCGQVLLLGVGHSNNTSIHLAEYRAEYPGKKIVKPGAPIIADGTRKWVWFDDVNTNDSDFARIGEDFSKETSLVASGTVGLASAMIMPQRELVDYSVKWIRKNRSRPFS